MKNNQNYSKKMLKNLRKILESEKKNRSIFDIIIYGSYMRLGESAKDIDILVIFQDGNLRFRLDCIQEMKIKLKKIIKKEIDIKQILLKELFSPTFFARTGVLIDGFSIFKNKPFSETLGFASRTVFSYNLKNLTHTQKVKFNYILAGRGKKGIIEEFKGKRINNGVVSIPVEKASDFENILKSNKVKYEVRNVLEEI